MTPVPFAMNLFDQRSNERVRVEGEFSDTQWTTFEVFRKAVRDLESTAYIRGQGSAGLTFKFNTAGQSVDGLPSSPILRELFHVLRPLVLRKEPTFALRIVDELAGAVDHPWVHQRAAHWRERFTGRRMQVLYTISIDETVLNSDEMLYLWLNAHEYHRDQDKQRRLEELHRGLSSDVTLGSLIALLDEKIEVVFEIARDLDALAGSPTVRRHFEG